MEAPPNKPEYPVPYMLAILVFIITAGIYAFIEFGANIADIGNNWPEVRCKPHIMPLAGLFGYDVNENFQFCIQQIIQENTKGVSGPFAQGMGGFTNILGNMMGAVNSFRLTLASLVGGIVKIISEFKSRMTALMGRVKLTGGRMKAMMYRLYGTMFAVMYMGMSAMTGIASFGDSFIFKFIDTFCFPPEQPIQLESGSYIPIGKVKIGMKLRGGYKVVSTYMFAANGQSMVKLGDIEVSSNHFVQHNKKWIMAKDHPDAIMGQPWSGGTKRPLICLTTDTHRINIGPYVFADYDETEKGDKDTQEWVDKSLNGFEHIRPIYTDELSYEVGACQNTPIPLSLSSVRLKNVKLGDILGNEGKVVGIQESETSEVCILPSGIKVAPGTLLWDDDADKERWVRAYTKYKKTVLEKPIRVIALFVSPGASYELGSGVIVRDAMEIYSPDTKKAYADALVKENLE